VEATEVDDRLVELLASSEGRLAPHLHMPLQSGADPVLRRMRRWHSREEYRRRTLEIAERVAPLGLGADVITGFPGETEEDHAATRALIEELPFTYLHVFPFSPRSDTVAADLPNSVPQRIAGDRSRDLRDLAQAKGRDYKSSRVGGPAAVVVERGGTALTGDYLRVTVPPGVEPEPQPPRRGDGAPMAAVPFTRQSLRSGTLRGDGDDLYIAWPIESSVISA
jgi:threonylcarbamoyladenosine tRNA methylthiotransferase MtaB